MIPSEFVEARTRLRLSQEEMAKKLGLPLWRLKLIERKAVRKRGKDIPSLISLSVSHLLSEWEAPKSLLEVSRKNKETLIVFKHGAGLKAEYTYDHYRCEENSMDIIKINCPYGDPKETDPKRKNENVCVNYAEALVIDFLIKRGGRFSPLSTIFAIQIPGEGLYDLSLSADCLEEILDWSHLSSVDSVRIAKRITGLHYCNGERRCLEGWVLKSINELCNKKDDSDLMVDSSEEVCDEIELDPIVEIKLEMTNEYEVVEWHYCCNLATTQSNPWVPFAVASTRDGQYFVICLDDRNAMIKIYHSLILNVSKPTGKDPAFFNNKESAWELVEMIVSQVWPDIKYDDIKGAVECLSV